MDSEMQKVPIFLDTVNIVEIDFIAWQFKGGKL